MDQIINQLIKKVIVRFTDNEKKTSVAALGNLRR